jgi:peptide/nickel transport system substrate-binding protein
MRRSLLLAASGLAAGVVVAATAAGGPQAVPQRGGTVVYAASFSEPACLNPLDARCAPGTAGATLARISTRVLERAFDVAPDFTWRPRLVSGASFTRSPPFTITYRIRPEARWSDGVPVTAADFVFTHEAIQKHGGGGADNIHRAFVRRVRAVDPKTVRVVLSSRFAGWHELFWIVLPRHLLQGDDLVAVWKDRIDNPRTGRPIGNGPFLVERWERGKQLTLVRNPRYWGPHHAYLDRLVFRFGVGGNVLPGEFRAGRLDVATNYAPGSFPDVRREPGVKTVLVPGSGWDLLELRVGTGGHPALRNKLVRQALAYGIDRGAMAQLWSEIDPRVRPHESSVFTSSSRFYQPNWGRYRYRPAEARRLLERAGCRRGADGVFACAGQRLSLRFATAAIQGGVRPEVIRLAQAQLRASGVEVVPVFAAQSVVFTQMLPKGDFDVVLLGLGTSPNPSWKPLYGCGAPLNYGGYCQRLVTRELDQAERIFDAREQARVLNKADVQLANDVPVIPLYEPPQWAAIRPSLRGFAPAALDPLTNAENWWLARS